MVEETRVAAEELEGSGVEPAVVGGLERGLESSCPHRSLLGFWSLWSAT